MNTVSRMIDRQDRLKSGGSTRLLRGLSKTSLAVALFGAMTSMAHAQSKTYAGGENNVTAVASPATLTVGAGDSATQSGAITGSGNITKDGAGTLTLAASSSYGSTTIAAGALQIVGGAKITNANALSMTGNNASLTISGVGSSLVTTSGNAIALSSTAGVTLNVVNGGNYQNTAGSAQFAQNTGTVGTLNVTGPGSTFFTQSSIGVKDGTAYFNVTDGGKLVHSGALTLGTNAIIAAAGRATVVVSGEGSSWTGIGSAAYIANASVSILDGGVMQLATTNIGTFANKTADVRISGAGSALNVTALNFGTNATAHAAITVANGGMLSISQSTPLTIGAGGTVNIGGAVGEAATDGGTLNVQSVALNGGQLNFNHNDSGYLFNLAISGNGTVNQTGSGTTMLTANTTYTGSTTITAGTLQLGNGGTTGSIVGNIADAGILAFNRSDAELALAGVISGAGMVQQIGSGTTTLTGIDTYTGATTITAGTLALAGNGAIAQSSGVEDNGTFDISAITGGAASITTLSGNGLVQLGGNTLNLTAAHDTFAGFAQGSGGVSLSSGAETFTGTNTYTGTTTISGGTLQLGNGGTTGSIVSDVIANGTLAFNRSNGLTYAGAISGSGAINQLGAGRTNVTGNSSSFTGTTSVTGGTLAVNGTLGDATSTMTVSNGGILAGAGTIGGSVTITDGHLAPGNSPGTLTINGNLSLSAASNLDYELGATGVVGGALNDLTVVGGNLTLDGTLNVTQSAGGTYGAGIYRLIDYSGTLIDNGLALGSMPAGTDNYVQTSIAHQVNLVNSQGLVLNYWDGDAGPKNNSVVDGGNGTWLAAPGNDNWTEVSGAINAPYQDAAFAIFAGQAGTVTVDNSVGAINVSGMQFATDGYLVQGDAINLTAGTNAIRVGDGTAAGAGVTATIASALTGPGKLDKVDLGTLVLTGSNTYTGGTTISGGILQLGNGGTSGSVVGDIVDNGMLAINRSNAVSLGAISGTGGLDQIGSGTTTLTGNNTYTGGTTISGGILQLGNGGTSGSVVGDIVDNGMLVINRSDAMSLGAISGTGGLDQVGSGTTTLIGNNSYSGATYVTAGTLAAGAANVFSATSDTAVASGATLNLAGYDQETGSLSNSGIVALSSTGTGTTLTVHGDYTGYSGVLQMGTMLGADASISDRLVIDGGQASGHTSIQLTSLGGLGALTTGDGIELVDAINGATTTVHTTADAFSLAGGHVDAGAFEYRLYAGDSSGAGENWYLRSSTNTPPNTQPSTPPSNGGGNGNAGGVVTYRPEVVLYSALSDVLRQADLSMLGNLHRRQGDDSSAPDNNGPRVWARLVSQNLQTQQKGTVAPSTDGSLQGLQAGIDLLQSGEFRAGVYAGRLQGTTRTNGFVSGIEDSRAGNLDVRNTYGGAYGTYMSNSGWYADAVLQYGWYNGRIDVRSGQRDDAGGTGVQGSLELGKDFPMSAHWVVEPQVQLIVDHMNLDDQAISGASVTMPSGSTLTSRLGIRFKGDYATEHGELQPYARFNIWHGSAGSDNVLFAGPAGSAGVTAEHGYTSGEIAVGSTWTVNPRFSVYGELGHVFSMDKVIGEQVKSNLTGSIGVRVNW